MNERPDFATGSTPASDRRHSPRVSRVTYVFLVTLVAALGGLLFGYDTGVINGAIGPLKAHFAFTPRQEGWAMGCALLGCAIGAGAAGALSDRFGRKKVLVLSAILFFISAVGTALPRTVAMFIVFRILGGLGVGAASITSPMYIAEISPARMRGRLVSVNQFAIVTGFLVVYFANFFIGAHGVATDRRAVTEALELVNLSAFEDADATEALLAEATTSEMAKHYGIGEPKVAEALARDILVKTALTLEYARTPEVKPLIEKQFQPVMENTLRAEIVEPLVGVDDPGGLERRIAEAVQEKISARGVSLEDQTETEEKLHSFVTGVVEHVVSLSRPVSEIVRTLRESNVEAWNVVRGWRWMFGSESLPAVLLLLLLFLVPESPRWLTKQGREAEALSILTRVDGAVYARTELGEITEAIARESGSLRQLLQPGMKIVLIIGIVLAVLQQVTGINVFLYFGTEIFKKMGAETNAALLQTVVVGVVNLTFTIIAIWTVDRIGRRPLMMIGSAGMGISLIAMGLAAFAQSAGLWMLLFILGYIACFALSVGPVTWVILSEIFPTRIRGRAMAVATVCLWIANYLVSQTFPMMDENPWLVEIFHRGFPFWLYGAFCIVLLLFVWRLVPETKGRTLEEIERQWLR